MRRATPPPPALHQHDPNVTQPHARAYARTFSLQEPSSCDLARRNVDGIRCATLNVHSLRNPARREATVDLVVNLQLDIFAIQETWLERSSCEQLQRELQLALPGSLTLQSVRPAHDDRLHLGTA